MQGERFNPLAEPYGSRLRTLELAPETFGLAGDLNATLALASIMNAFPRAVAQLGRPLPIKCDILKATLPTDLAFATRRDDCFWILFSDRFIQECATNAILLASMVPRLEPALFRGVQTDHLLAIVRDMTMEIVVHHELCHVKYGHVDVATAGGGLGLAESRPKKSANDIAKRFQKAPFRQRPMEFIADEAAMGAPIFGSGKGRWILIHPDARKVLDTRALALAAYLGMLSLVVAISPGESPEGYPSLPARMLHFHVIFRQYVRAASLDASLEFCVDPDSLIEEAHVVLDVVNEAAKLGLLEERSASFKRAVSPMFSPECMEIVQAECAVIANECHEEMHSWEAFRGNYVTWQEYVAFERRNGRNPKGLPPL